MNNSFNENLKEYALREVKLATLKESDVCYEVAYKAFCDFLDRAEELNSNDFEIAKNILIQLFYRENLSPIIDYEKDWFLFDQAAGNDNSRWSIYRCKRRNSLFKKVTYDRKTGEVNEVTFKDIDRAICMDINKPDCMYTGGIGPLILDEMMPITLPYSPCGKIRIFTEDFKYHENCDEDLDTVGVLYFRMPDGTIKEVKRYFKRDSKSKQMVEIKQGEYLSRKKRVEERMSKI